MLCIPLTRMVGRHRPKRKSTSAQRPIYCGMLGYSDTTSYDTSRTSEGKSMMLHILRMKSFESLINEGIDGIFGWWKKSSISVILSLAEPHADTPLYTALYTFCMHLWKQVEMSRLNVSTNGKLSNIISNNSFDVELIHKMLNVFLYVADGMFMSPWI